MKALRYMMAAVLVLALLCAGAAMAAPEIKDAAPQMNNPTTGLSVGLLSGDVPVFDIVIDKDTKSYDWKYQAWDAGKGKWTDIGGVGGTGLTANSTAVWNFANNVDVWLDVTGEEMVRLVVTSVDAKDKKTEQIRVFYVDYTSDRILHDRLTFAKWFPHNTACVYGPKMNALVPGIGSRDNITAAVVDLTKEGTQTFKLVAADQWEIGKVFVNVNGDEVTVTYQMTEDINTRDIWDEIVVEKEWFTIFPTKASITSAKRDDLGDGYTFGAPISIANDLGGATTVVLYVNSTVTFGAHNPYVYRFWTNSRYETGARNAMQELYNSVAD